MGKDMRISLMNDRTIDFLRSPAAQQNIDRGNWDELYHVALLTGLTKGDMGAIARLLRDSDILEGMNRINAITDERQLAIKKNTYSDWDFKACKIDPGAFYDSDPDEIASDLTASAAIDVFHQDGSFNVISTDFIRFFGDQGDAYVWRVDDEREAFKRAVLKSSTWKEAEKNLQAFYKTVLPEKWSIEIH